jgi:two-component system sensor histidine kinase YesM
MLSIKRTLVLSNILIVLAVSVSISLLFSHFVMKPLRDLLTAIHEVESGNWNATVKGISNDELGIVGSSFNAMIEEMKKLYGKNMAKERELSRIKLDLEHKGRVEELNTQLELKIEELETANRAVTSLSGGKGRSSAP